jgi:rhodanese-related sulfurtransferase
MGSAGVRAEVHDTLAYGGEVSPQQAWDVLKADKDAVLVDVRTPVEWTFAGEADLGSIGKEALKLSWKTFPSYTLNDQFAATLKSTGIKQDAPLFFICRTGGRSLDAACAMTAEGYTHCYNVTDGFEGPLDQARHRGTVAGWKASGLPWGQG